MLHSLYDFKATYAKTLSFRANEFFVLHQTNTKHKNWWEVINEEGQMGFIPSNYVEKMSVNASYYIQFLDTCIDRLKRNEVASEYIIGDRREVIAHLKELKRQAENLPEISENSIGANGDNVPPLLFRNSDGQLETVTSTKNSSTSSATTEARKSETVFEEPIRPVQKYQPTQDLKKSIENIHQEILSEWKKSESSVSSSAPSKASPVITYQSVFELVESVRINTKLSHEMSRVAVVTVIQGF